MDRPEPKKHLMALDPYIGGEWEIAGQQKVIKLSANEAALGPSPQAQKAYQAAAAHLHRYPDGNCTALRTALAKRFTLDPDRIICGNGSDELLALLARAYTGPGDEVIISQYGFLYYAIATRATGARLVIAGETNYTTDIDQIIKAVTPRTRLLFLANPNNPTGSYLGHEDMMRLITSLPKRILIILDAAYAEYVEEKDYRAGSQWVETCENVVMTRTFSKIFGLSALRLGWAYVPLAVGDVLNRLRGPFNINGAAQAAALAALADHAFLDKALSHNRIWRARLSKALQDLGLQVYPSVTNFLLVAFPPDKEKHAPAAEAFLKTRHILPRRVDNYGLPQCLRFTIGNAEDNQALIEALREFCHSATISPP